jgi:hypothetical protein
MVRPRRIDNLYRLFFVECFFKMIESCAATIDPELPTVIVSQLGRTPTKDFWSFRDYLFAASQLSRRPGRRRGRHFEAAYHWLYSAIQRDGKFVEACVALDLLMRDWAETGHAEIEYVVTMLEDATEASPHFVPFDATLGELLFELGSHAGSCATGAVL